VIVRDDEEGQKKNTEGWGSTYRIPLKAPNSGVEQVHPKKMKL